MDKPVGNRNRKQGAILGVVLAACLIGWVVMSVNDRRAHNADPDKAERLQRSEESADMFRQREKDAKADGK